MEAMEKNKGKHVKWAGVRVYTSRSHLMSLRLRTEPVQGGETAGDVFRVCE